MLMEKYIEMPRLNAVWNHPLYQKYYRENEKIEHDREFCCHQITHLLDVARIAYIKNLEEMCIRDRVKGVVQGAFLMADGVYLISMIYLGCVQAMCQINLKEQEEAIQTVS